MKSVVSATRVIITTPDTKGQKEAEKGLKGNLNTNNPLGPFSPLFYPFCRFSPLCPFTILWSSLGNSPPPNSKQKNSTPKSAVSYYLDIRIS